MPWGFPMLTGNTIMKKPDYIKAIKLLDPNWNGKGTVAALSILLDSLEAKRDKADAKSKAVNRYNKVHQAILAIETDFVNEDSEGDHFSVEALEQYLDHLRGDAGDAREKAQQTAAEVDALAAHIDEALDSSVENQCAEWRAEAIADIRNSTAARGALQSHVGSLMKVDLILVPQKTTEPNGVQMVNAKLETRNACNKKGEPTDEVHEFYACDQLSQLREDIQTLGNKESPGYDSTFNARGALTSLNNALRIMCDAKHYNIPKIQMQGNEKGGRYFRSYPDVNAPELSDAEQAAATRKAKRISFTILWRTMSLYRTSRLMLLSRL